MKSKKEKEFINKLKCHKNICLYNDTKNQITEGFEYLSSKKYKVKNGAIKNRGITLLKSNNIKASFKLFKHMIKLMPSMMKNINKNFLDMDDYMKAISKGEKLPETNKEIIENFPNKNIYEELKRYAFEKYSIIVGFTEVPKEYIFDGKIIPFKYALVFIQEMKKEEIEKAPNLEAGMEVGTVYNSLGIATNEINMWLRNKYGIIGMANHPLGGLVDYIPLAEKAGLGRIGRHGLLITKEFGPRCRISPIFIDKKIFEYTYTNKHNWINKYCEKCGKCKRNCPEKAIYESPILAISYEKTNIRDRYKAFDKEKCFKSFSAKMGCSICIKECPFSINPKIYEIISKKHVYS